jgi:hypothetical protein
MFISEPALQSVQVMKANITEGAIMPVLRKWAPHSLCLIAPSVLALGLTATSVNALTINPEFSSSITGAADAASIEGAINAAIKTVDSLYSNTGTVGIVFTAAAGGNFVAQGSTADYSETYLQYTFLLGLNSIKNPANTTLSTAIANLGTGNKPGAGGSVLVTSADARVALGLASATGFYNSSGNFVGGGGQAYDGVITLNNALPLNFTTKAVTGEYSAITAFEAQINEILGGGGQGSVLNQIPAGGSKTAFPNIGVLDLYRYSAPGVPSFSSANGTYAYFSVDGGNTDIIQFSDNPSEELGDFSPNGYVQSAVASRGTEPAYTTSSPEFTMMESIGYDPVTATPLPSTWTMLLAGFVCLGFMASRGTKNHSVSFGAA